jgi:signal peptidase II
MLELFIVLFIVIIDQFTKYLTVTHLRPIESVTVIEGIFSFTYVENTGAAFGILQNHRWVFIALTIAIVFVMIYFLFFHIQNIMILKISITMILGGAIGNLVDRIRIGYVIDMLHVTFIDFPVFNIADAAVVIGTILLIFYLLFISGKPIKAK